VVAVAQRRVENRRAGAGPFVADRVGQRRVRRHIVREPALIGGAALLCLLTVAGVSVAAQRTVVPQTRIDTIRQHARFFLFAHLLAAVAIVILFGRRLLDWDDNAGRFWPTAIVVLLACLVLAVLFVPLRSYRHLLQRRRPSVLVQVSASAASDRPVRRPFLVTAGLGCVAAVLPFLLLLYRAADYRMPDSYVLDDRVRPEVGWAWVGLYLALAVLAIGVGLRSGSRGPTAKRWPAQPTFFAAALCLGIVHFSGVGLAGRPKEFIRALVCLDRNSGKVLWTCEGLRAQTRPQNRVVTHAAPTPTTDGRRIYAHFGEDGLMCVSPEGKLLWKRTEPMFRCKFGVGTSPVVKDDILVIASDVKESQELPSALTAYDGVCGKPLWKKERTSHKDYATYCTPSIKSVGGTEVVIVHGWHDLKGYELETGAELWSYPMTHEGQHLVASLVSDAERLYVTGAKRIIALDVSKLGTGSDPAVWSRPLPGEKSATPVVVEGLLFLVTEPGLAYCLEARTGEILWKQRLPGRYFSSVVALGRHVLFTNEAGRTTVVAADREYREVAANALGEPVYASFAPAGDRLFARTTKHVYCIQEK
jgi:outer membrane protein assembly factor BamB